MPKSGNASRTRRRRTWVVGPVRSSSSIAARSASAWARSCSNHSMSDFAKTWTLSARFRCLSVTARIPFYPGRPWRRGLYRVESACEVRTLKDRVMRPPSFSIKHACRGRRPQHPAGAEEDMAPEMAIARGRTLARETGTIPMPGTPSSGWERLPSTSDAQGIAKPVFDVSQARCSTHHRQKRGPGGRPPGPMVGSIGPVSRRSLGRFRPRRRGPW